MTKDQIQKEIARTNRKIEMRLEEIKRIAHWMMDKINDEDAIVHYTTGQAIAQQEAEIRELIASRDTLKEIFGEE